MPIGRMQIMAKAVKPAVRSSYKANKNRRKSNNTLPPPNLPDVELSAFIGIYATIWHGCFLQQSDPTGTDDIQSC